MAFRHNLNESMIWQYYATLQVNMDREMFVLDDWQKVTQGVFQGACSCQRAQLQWDEDGEDCDADPSYVVGGDSYLLSDE